jgi:Tfp pilus assembly protein PilP
VTVRIVSKAVARSLKNPALCFHNRGGSANRWVKQLLWPFLPMLLCCPMTTAGATNTNPSSSVAQTKNPLESPIKYANVVYRSGNRRDPFINPLLVKKREKPQEDEEISRGLPPPGIAGTYIAQATLQGIASRDTGKVAVFRGADSRAYFLRKGDKLFDGYLKDIHDDSVTLVRETKLRSGKILTQDVTKRLRTP